jgi:glycosyltransferase involved in cell wall biosynthesis
LFSLFYLIFIYSRDRKIYLWCFEGREHFWSVLFKLLFVFRRKSIVLIRLRGQAQKQKKSFLGSLIYFLTDKIVLTSNIMKRDFPFKLPSEKITVHHFMKDTIGANSCEKELSQVQKSFFSFHSSDSVFASVGRFDPVKGHKHLIEGFCQTPFGGKACLVIIGCSENIKAKDLMSIAKKYLFKSEGALPYIKLKKDRLSLYLVDEKIKGVSYVMENAHYGVISSLGSEMICRVGVEFLQLGTPLISSKVGALEEVLDSNTTIFYDHLSCESLINAFLKAERNIKDSKGYNNLSISAEKFGRENYSLDGFQKLLTFVTA